MTGVIVLGSFHLGSAFFITGITEDQGKAAVKNFSEETPRLSELEINLQDEKKVIPSAIVQEWFESYTREYTGKKDIRVSPERVDEYLASMALLVNVQPVNAKFILVDGPDAEGMSPDSVEDARSESADPRLATTSREKAPKVKEFIPSEYGRRLDIETSKKLIISAITSGKKETTLPVELLEPAITLDKVNELGITTLIGQGESDFGNSPPSRIHNIKVGSAKYNGTILKPGETFSFNSLLGEVDEQNGYQPELVIKKGKLIYEYGGGLCQVSTTLFRAAIMAGLPVVERRPHSFPVRYYDPQGFDATIYPGVVDLKFKNDTSSHILIQSKIENTRLIFDIYGPDDGRKVALEGPVQYDQKPSGAMKAYFVRKTTLVDGSIKEERFNSKYGAPAPLERNPLE